MSVIYTPTAVRRTSYVFPTDGQQANAASVEPQGLDYLGDQGAYLEGYARAAYGIRAVNLPDGNAVLTPGSDPTNPSPTSYFRATALGATRSYFITDTYAQDGDWCEVANASNPVGSGTPIGSGFGIQVFSPVLGLIGTVYPGGVTRFARISGTWIAIDSKTCVGFVPINMASYTASDPGNTVFLNNALFSPLNTTQPAVSLAFATADEGDSIVWPLGQLPRSGFIANVVLRMKQASLAPSIPAVLSLIRDDGDGTCALVGSGTDGLPDTNYHDFLISVSETIQLRPYYVKIQNQNGASGLTVIGGYVRVLLG